MNVCTIDGKAHFASHLINTENGEKIMCFNLQELNQKKSLLTENYTVEELVWDSTLIEKTQNKKFNSRTELIEFLQNDILPESEIIPSLKKENEELKIKLTDTENALLGMMFL